MAVGSRAIDLPSVSVIEFTQAVAASAGPGTPPGVALPSVIDLYTVPLMSVRRFDVGVAIAVDVRDERGRGLRFPVSPPRPLSVRSALPASSPRARSSYHRSIGD